METSDPFFWHGSEQGCLLIHGFGGNPSDLRPLADGLAARGFTVDLPLLPGHGPTPEGTAGVKWRDWVEAVAARRDRLQRSCREVIIVGFSMGGALALVEAARCAPTALALIAMPTFVDRDWRARFLPIFKYVVRWWYPLMDADFADPLVRANILNRSPGVELDDPRVQAEIRRNVRIPTAAIDHFLRITRRARSLIPTIAVPTLIVQGRKDRTAVPVCAEEIYRKLASRQKKLIWFDHSGHHLVTGNEGPAVVEQVVTWVMEQISRLESLPAAESAGVSASLAEL